MNVVTPSFGFLLHRTLSQIIWLFTPSVFLFVAAQSVATVVAKGSCIVWVMIPMTAQQGSHLIVGSSHSYREKVGKAPVGVVTRLTLTTIPT